MHFRLSQYHELSANKPRKNRVSVFWLAFLICGLSGSWSTCPAHVVACLTYGLVSLPGLWPDWPAQFAWSVSHLACALPHAWTDWPVYSIWHDYARPVVCMAVGLPLPEPWPAWTGLLGLWLAWPVAYLAYGLPEMWSSRLVACQPVTCLTCSQPAP